MKRRVIPLLLAVFLFAGMFGPARAEADAAPELPWKKQTVYLTESILKYGYVLPINNAASSSQIQDLRSSNTNVALVMLQNHYMGNSLDITLRNPGKTFISFTGKYGNGQTESQKVVFKLTAKKYENPCRSFRIGGREYAPFFKTDTFYTAVNPNILRKLTVEPKKGWNLIGITLYRQSGEIISKKNGKKINTKGCTSISVEFQRKDSKEKQTLELLF